MSMLRRAWERRSIASDPPAGYGVPGFGEWLSGMRWSPATVGSATVEQSMQLSAVFACLRLLSEAIATLPLGTFRRTAHGRESVDAPVWLRFVPPGESRITFLSKVMMSLLTDGNSFIWTQRDDDGEVIALSVLDPTQVEVGSIAGLPEYRIGSAVYGHLDLLPIRGMTLGSSERGISPLTAARLVVDGGRKAQEFGSALHANSAVPPAIIELPESGNATIAREVGKLWNETHGGTANAGKVGVLMGGASLKTIAVNPADAEWLDSKKFSVAEIARFFGVPPHLIADASNSTSWGSGLAEQNLAFGQFSLRPWSERIEEGLGRLFALSADPDLFVKLNLDALLRSSLSDRYASYKVGIESGFLTVNEARELEDLPPIANQNVDTGGGVL